MHNYSVRKKVNSVRYELTETKCETDRLSLLAWSNLETSRHCL